MSASTTKHVHFNRRGVLQVGGLSALGIGLADVLGLQQADADKRTGPNQAKGRAKSCILIWLDGGPSHLETFDLKPDATTEVRGPFKSIATKVPGVRISECLPRTAAMLDKVAIIRSMTSPLGEHNFGSHYLMTGYKPTPVLEYPTYGAVLAHLNQKQRVLPPYVAVPSFRVGGSQSTGGGYLPPAVRPFSIGADPSSRDFEVKDLDFYKGLTLNRVDRRRKFVNALDRFSKKADEGSVELNSDLERAYRLIASKDAKEAFDIEAEPQSVRNSYGMKSIGQCCLMARRLVERGVPFVTVNNRGWDTHTNLVTRLKDGYVGARNPVGLIPSLDLALTGLISDLVKRNLFDETLILVMGEFGRTPKLNTNAGRDHWPRVFSVLMAGGGVPGGQVIGSSDSVGEGPKDRPITPSDLAATIYTLLGIDPKQELHTSDGRPVRIAPFEAKPIAELVG